MTETSRSRAPGRYVSTRASVSWRNAVSSAASSSDGSWTRVIPTELPRRAGLTMSRGSPVAGRERRQLRRTRVAGRSPSASRVTSRQSTTGRPSPRHSRLKMRLVHADRRGGHARPGVGQAGRLEQRLDGAVLAERPVERDDHDRRGSRGGQPVDGGAERDRAGRRRARPGRRRSRPGGRRADDRPAATTSRRRGRSGPARRRGRRRPARRRSPCPTRSRRRARPTARRAGHDDRRSGRSPVIGRRLASRSSRRANSISNASSRRAGRGPRPGRARRAGGRPPRCPFWSLTMKLACFSETTAPPIRRPLSPAASISRPAESPRRVAEDAPGRRQPERLVRLAPAADVVEPGLDHVRVGRRRAGTSPRRRRRGRLGTPSSASALLEPAVAVGQPEVRPPRRCAPSRRRRGRGPTRGPPRYPPRGRPALAQTAPPTVPGMASPNSSPVRPAVWVSVAARAIGRRPRRCSGRRRCASPRPGPG